MITHAKTFNMAALNNRAELKYSSPEINIFDDEAQQRTVRNLRIHKGGAVLEIIALRDFDPVKNRWTKEVARQTKYTAGLRTSKKLAELMLEEIKNSNLTLDQGLSTHMSSIYYA